MLGTRTRGGRMVGTDECAELWRHPLKNFLPWIGLNPGWCDERDCGEDDSRDEDAQRPLASHSSLAVDVRVRQYVVDLLLLGEVHHFVQSFVRLVFMPDLALGKNMKTATNLGRQEQIRMAISLPKTS